ncbi:uncharacterized protein [Anser cygnoides]|uniref:uncharacterized protein isoform X2 n=1 Tax=Anser cygnoides TaxID=8845 RepID=UPI00200941C4|nr:uncharacterized protein LOC106042289 isoform X2 [Anser cygnoides]
MKENITQKNITRHVTQNISLLLTNKTSTDSQETRVQSFHKEKVAPYQQIMQGYRLYKLMCKEVTLQGILEALLCTRLHLQLSYGSDEASSNQRLLLYGFPESSMISFSSTSTYSFPWLPKKTLFPLRAAHQCITLLRAPLKAEDVLQGHPQLLFMDARQMLLRSPWLVSCKLTWKLCVCSSAEYHRASPADSPGEKEWSFNKITKTHPTAMTLTTLSMPCSLQSLGPFVCPLC